MFNPAFLCFRIDILHFTLNMIHNKIFYFSHYKRDWNMSETKHEEKTSSYLSFQLGEETFATDVGKVLEILELCPITKVPRAPEYMRGVINLRGKVLPVLDTRIKFGLGQTQDDVNTCIIVLNIQMEETNLQLGALVDSVDEVIKLGAGDIEPPPSLGHNFNPEYLHGMVRKEDTFVMILDVDKVFSTHELDQVSQTTRTVSSQSAKQKGVAQATT